MEYWNVDQSDYSNISPFPPRGSASATRHPDEAKTIRESLDRYFPTKVPGAAG